jgi:hypothetical protein
MTAVPLPIRVRYLVRRAGWPALAGAALLAAAAGMEFGMLAPAQDKLAGLRTAIVKARAQRNAPQAGAADAGNLLAALPALDTLESSIAVIHETAIAQNLITTGAEYRSRKEAGGDMLRYEIALPFKGGYAPLRNWLAELRLRQPALAIDELNLHRVAAEAGQLDGRLRFVLFLRTRAVEGAVLPAPVLPSPQFAAATGDFFAVRSWQPPPPPAPPPAKPKAPPLPFKYTGKLIEDKVVRVFLTQGDTTTLVAQGDKLGNYDIERVTTASVVLLFRPLNEQQTLNFGGYD